MSPNSLLALFKRSRWEKSSCLTVRSLRQHRMHALGPLLFCCHSHLYVPSLFLAASLGLSYYLYLIFLLCFRSSSSLFARILLVLVHLIFCQFSVVVCFFLLLCFLNFLYVIFTDAALLIRWSSVRILHPHPSSIPLSASLFFLIPLLPPFSAD